MELSRKIRLIGRQRMKSYGFQFLGEEDGFDIYLDDIGYLFVNTVFKIKEDEPFTLDSVFPASDPRELGKRFEVAMLNWFASNGKHPDELPENDIRCDEVSCLILDVSDEDGKNRALFRIPKFMTAEEEYHEA